MLKVVRNYWDSLDSKCEVLVDSVLGVVRIYG